MDHDADFDAHLQAGDVAFTERDATLLRAVDETGSLNEAASSLGRSYSRAHGRLTDLEAAFGDLVERHRGGADGGGSALTDRARDLLAEYDRLRTGYASVAETATSVLAGRVTGRDGELGTVATDAGTVTAIVPPDADRVEVSVRADAITLHAPDDTPAESATSARNRFAGVVRAVERGERVSRVTVDVGAETPLVALVTERSRDRLALEPGRDVVASFKATATRATAIPPSSDET